MNKADTGSASGELTMDAQHYRTAQLALFETLAAGTTAATIIPQRQQYVGVAVALTLLQLLPAELCAQLHATVLDELQEFQSSHYWYPDHDLHLTLKNVQSALPGRTFGADVIARAAHSIERACKTIPPLTFEILGPIRLPTSIMLRAIATPAHRDAVLSLHRELATAGVPDDKVYASMDVFVGNITLCRFTEPPSDELLRKVASLHDRRVAQHTMDAVSFVRCDEVCSRESRAVLQVFPLSGRP